MQADQAHREGRTKGEVSMKEHTTDNLRRCPFCGGEAAVETTQNDVSVSCTACGIAVSGFTYNPDDKATMYDAINTAVKEWNQIKP